MRFGNVTLRLISAGTYWADGAGLFGIMPKVRWQQIVEPDELNRVPVALRCLLIETSGKRILVDTGYGDKVPDKERRLMSFEGGNCLLRCLESLDIQPRDVHMVINTHLHNDHCGGNTCYGETGIMVPTFPHATYCVQRMELAEATFPNERTRAVYRRENFGPLEDSGQLRALQGDTRLTAEVRVMLTPGHTPGHQSVVIESAGRTAIFLGDVTTWPIHMEQLACLTAFDVQPLVNIETKRRLARWSIDNEALLIFEHHPEIVAGYLHPTERADRFRLEPIEFDP
jgi:glyoxylase-like metal-dependent hydrolase (beta-lactamase superfamily II)